MSWMFIKKCSKSSQYAFTVHSWWMDFTLFKYFSICAVLSCCSFMNISHYFYGCVHRSSGHPSFLGALNEKESRWRVCFVKAITINSADSLMNKCTLRKGERHLIWCRLMFKNNLFSNLIGSIICAWIAKYIFVPPVNWYLPRTGFVFFSIRATPWCSSSSSSSS